MNASDIATWMFQKLQQQSYLYQEEAVDEIQSKFGEQFVYENENGGLSIDKRILKEFRKLTEKTVVWERGERYWRLREDHDDPNRRQADY